MTDKEIVERAKEAEKRTGFGELVHSPISKGVNSAFGIGFIEGMVEYRNFLQEEPVSEDEIEKSFSAGDVVVYVSRHPAYSGLYLLGFPNDLSIGYSCANEPYQIYLRNCTIASEDERKQFMRELNLNGYKWNENTLRIEKIEKPVSEDLEDIATQLSQKYFPDEENIWARPNIEAQRCKSACIEIVEWLKAQKGE